MKIVVLNGSPKGDLSVTMQYVKYIQKKYSQHEFKIINITQRINQIEKEEGQFADIIEDIRSSNGVIWGFPLYVFTVHSGYQRFIELIFERNAEEVFRGKYTALLATSIHFFDHTALNYMNSICDDLNMHYVDYFSLHMRDLEKESIRKNLLSFAENYFEAINNKKVTLKNYNPIIYSQKDYISENTFDKIDISNKKLVILADSLENSNIKNMVDKLRDSYSQPVELLCLKDINIKGGCLGCMRCGYNYECAYTGKDDFIDFYNNKLRTADIIVFAGDIKYRYLSSDWKRFLDRGFFNTHTPSLSGKQIGFIISGPLRQVPNLRQVLESYVQWQGANAAGFLTDEYETNKEIDERLNSYAKELIKLSTINYSKPTTFLGVGGMKIFRDEIWGDLRFPFVADHKAYRKLKVYDFPQKNYKTRIINFIVLQLVKIPSIRKEIYQNRLKIGMVEGLKKIVDNDQV